MIITRDPIRFVCLLAVSGILVDGQTTQGLISGRILDLRSNGGIAGAAITCSSLATNTNAAALTDDAGYYSLPLLPPGRYRVRADSGGFQGQEAQELELLVAGRLQVDFQLRPLSDIWEAGQFRNYVVPGNRTIVTYYGPDLDETHTALLDPQRARQGTLEATVSSVIDPLQLDSLPLAGRDVYNLLVIQAAVTSDGGTSRGLGLSISGQRPTASNFLLDGVENNNYLVTGPLVTVAPEAVQEYRVSTSNYSAEYGRTAGFLANAVTRAGGNSWHGIGYFYAQNEALDADTFRRNLQGEARKHDRQFQPGVQAGGPIWRDRLFISGSYEYFHGASQGDLEQTLTLPSGNLINVLPAGSEAHDLLTRFPTPAPAAAGCSAATLNACVVSVTMALPETLERNLGLLRLDYISANGRHRIFGRLNINRVTRPDFIWSPYRQFVSSLQDPAYSGVISDVYAISPRLTNEAKASFASDGLMWQRANAQIPGLITRFGTAVTLPGPYQQVDPFSNQTKNGEVLDNLVWTGSRHILKAGAGALLRHIDGALSPQQAGIYAFNTLASFAQDSPANVEVSLLRGPAGAAANLASPDFNRAYRYNQYFAFVQDTFQVRPRLTLNYGLRYENFGAPVNVGSAKDVMFSNGALVFPRGDQPLFTTDNRDFGFRLGASYSPVGFLVIRAGYGIFYDRPYDNLWQTIRNNSIFFSLNSVPGTFHDYLNIPARQALALLSPPRATGTAPNITYFQNGLRNGYAQNMFLGVQQRLAGRVFVELNGLSSLGRELLTNDFPGRPVYSNVVYRGNQGISDYYALAATARYQKEALLLQATYTWSHSIDNQSDALGLDLFDFGFSSAHQVSPGFLNPGDSRGDRGNSDFDQRQNLVFAAVASLPGRLFKNWTVAGLGAFRTGFPFTVYGSTLASRAYILDPQNALLAHPVPQDGGLLLLNRAAFATKGVGGVSGRNAFRGPGFYNVDLSVARNFRLPHTPEWMLLKLRADAYNILNHANLDKPDNILGDPGFGVASYGRLGTTATFPTQTPLADIARQVQLSIHLSF